MTFPDAYISIIKEENINDGGYVQLEWNDTESEPLSVGTECPIDSNYVLFSKYYPNQSAAGRFRYNPKFMHRLYQLDFLPFYFNTEAVTGVDGSGNVTYEDVVLSTYPYTGNISTIANALADCLNDHGDLGEWTADTSGLSNSVIKSINFDGATIKSAAKAIADAYGVDYYFIWSTRTIKFGNFDAEGVEPSYGTTAMSENGVTETTDKLVSASDGGVQYNTFRVLGGTKNMSKKTVRGQNVQVTQRLMLDENDSIIDTRPAGSNLPKIMKDIVFDDIFPKMELWMYDVHERRCYLTDENGKKIIDSQTIDPETGGTITTYKQFSKWYFKLARWNGTELVPYVFNTNLIIEGLKLAMEFQPNYEDNALPQPLVGREFELTYFDAANPAAEVDENDVNGSGYQPVHGEYRIIFKVEGNMILPSTSEENIRPYGDSMSLANNKVTLTNVAMDSIYEQAAKVELRTAALDAIDTYVRDKSSFTYNTYGAGPTLGGVASGGIVTSVRRNLITGEVQYTVGDYKSSKGLIGRLSDKIDTAGVTGGGASTNDSSNKGGGVSETSIPLLSRLMGSGNVVKDTLTVLRELILGTNGHGIFIDQRGDASMTIGALTVLGTTHLNEIDVNHVRHTGGMMVVTKANLIVDSYEVLEGNLWRLYYRRRDGNGQTIHNLFEIGDFALMMTYNEGLSGSVNRYFWRQVVDAGIKMETVTDETTGETSSVETDLGYITLNYGSFNTVPKEGDVVVQLGNISVEERQGATVLGGSGSNGGFFAIYEGISSIGVAAPNLDDYNNALIYLSPKKNKLTGNFVSTSGNDLQSQLDALRASLASITQQSDRQLVIWYGDDDTPYPTSGHLNEYNTPAKDWHDADVQAGNTDQQELHLEDVYYLRRNNTTRTGGRAWQWIYDEYLEQFLWLEISDVDVIAALEAADDAVATANDAKEKVLNLADDGIISAGTEKSELLIQWQDTVAEYLKLIEQAEDYDMDENANAYHSFYSDYESKYNLLAIMLNAFTDTNIASIKSGNGVPAWLSTLNVDTNLEDYIGITGIDGNVKSTLDGVKNEYRARWEAYAGARSALLKAIEAAAKAETDRAHGRIDDIASDGIISAGTEKSLLYIDWLKAVAEYKKYTEQAEDYFGENNTQDDDLVTAYTALATMLNNGTSPTTNILNGVDRPSWLTAANMNVDTVLSETPTLTAANYHSVWNTYQSALNALLKDITAKAKELADAAQVDATNALNQISDMGNDGKLDPSEKLTVKREFVAAYHEMMDDGSNGSSSGILDMAKDNSNNWIIDNATWIAPYIAAFRAIGTYLNGGASWTEPALSSFSDSSLPSWIQDANMGNTQNITGSTWRGLWAEFYSRRTAVLTALTDNAQDTADTANNRLNDIADDGKLDPTEKMVVRREFVAAWRERDAQGGLIDRCYDTNNNPLNSTIVSSYLNPYKNAFLAVANYLNGSNGTWTDTTYPTLNIDDYIPLWLHIARKDTTETINGEMWRSLWSAFYTARTALLTALSDDAKERADDAQDTANEKKRVFSTDANELPPVPYDEGDLWMNAVWNSQGASWQNGDPTWAGDQLICIRSKGKTGTPSISDWADAATGTTARIQNLGTQIEAEVRNRKQGTSSSLKLDSITGGLYVDVYDPNTNTWTTAGLIQLALVKEGSNTYYSKLNLTADNVEMNASLVNVVANTIQAKAALLDFQGGAVKIDASNIGFKVGDTMFDVESGLAKLLINTMVGISGKDAPTGCKNSSWSESPINATSSYPYMWMRTQTFDGENIASTTYIRLKTGSDTGKGVRAQFTASIATTPSGAAIHDSWQSGDIYMRIKGDDDSDWGDWFLVTGERGDETTICYGISQYDSSANANTAPSDISSWSDIPVAPTSSKPYLWKRVQQKTWNSGQSYTINNTRYLMVTGNNAVELIAQYSSISNPSESDIHNIRQSGDTYMRTRLSNDSNSWSSWHKIGGEKRYSFNISTSATLASGDTSTQVFQQQIGMVIRKETDEAAGEFSFGTYVGGVFKQGLKFETDNGNTKLVLAADTTVVKSDFKVDAQNNIDFNGKTISLNASSTLSISGGTVNLKGTTVQMDADNMQIESGTLTLTGKTIGITGGTINLSATSKLNLTSANLSINADQLTYSGRTIDLTAATISLNADQLTYRGRSIDLTAANLTLNAGQLTYTGQTIDLTAATVSLGADQITFTGKTIALGTSKSKVTINGGDIQVASNKTLSFSSGSIDFTGATVSMSGDNISFSATNSFKAAVGNSGVVLSENLISAFIEDIESTDGQALSNKMGLVISRGYASNAFGFGYYTYNSSTQQYDWTGGLNFEITTENNVRKVRLFLSADTAKINADALLLDGKTVNISANKAFTVSSSGELSLSGGTIEIEGSASVTIKSGSTMTLNSGSTLNLTAATVNLNAGQLTYSGQTIDLSSSTVNLNSTNLTLWARYIDFNSETITISAGQSLTFKGGTSSGQTQGTISFTGARILMNAEQINFKSGSFAINNGTKDTFKVTSAGNVTVSGTINADSGYFKGELQGATGTFSGSLTSNDEKVLLTSTGLDGWGLGYVWRGFAVSNNSFQSGDLATIGARINDGGYDYGRIALVKRSTGTSSSNISTSDMIILDASDQSVTCNKIDSVTISNSGDVKLSGILKVIQSSTFTLPANPVNGQMYIVKGMTDDAYVAANGHAIVHGDSNADNVGANGTWNIGGETALLIYSSTLGKWVMVYSA